VEDYQTAYEQFQIVVHPFANRASHITTSTKLSAYPDSLTYGGPMDYISPKSQLIKGVCQKTEVERELELFLPKAFIWNYDNE